VREAPIKLEYSPLTICTGESPQPAPPRCLSKNSNRLYLDSQTAPFASRPAGAARDTDGSLSRLHIDPARLANDDRRCRDGDPRGRCEAMTTVAMPRRSPLFANGEQLCRDFLFLATFLLTWFTASPFPDLSDAKLLEPQTSGNLLGQISMLLITGALAAFVLLKRPPLVRRIVTVPLTATLVAFAISAVLSSYPDVALRRLVLAGFTIFQGSTILLLPCGRERFARLLVVAAVLILAACYIGVAFFPHYSVHQASDIAERGLAGDWRGFFTHKNGAGAAMGVLIFIGIYVYRSCDRIAGISIVILAALFLEFTHSKSPRNLLPVVLGLSYLIPRMRGWRIAWALAVMTPLILNLLTLGSVMFAPISRLVSAVLPDPTYDGRDVIWQFALDHVAARPFFGFGFESFWRMPNLVAEWNYLESWGYQASDAHNGYLNLAVTTGLVGLALSMFWVIGQGFIDYRRALARGADRPLVTLFLQIWLFCLCLGCFESVFFSGGDGLWFLTVASIAGFRFLSLAKTSA
jgi:O-antigen ligase